MFTKSRAIEAEGDEATGVKIVLRALEEPVRQIAHKRWSRRIRCC